jgi:hypothetical protein
VWALPRDGQRSDLAGWAGYGYCASHSRCFWGLHLHLISTVHGLPDLGRRDDLLRRLNQAYGRDAADAVQAVAAAVHGHQTMSIRPMVTHTAALVGRLR